MLRLSSNAFPGAYPHGNVRCCPKPLSILSMRALQGFHLAISAHAGLDFASNETSRLIDSFNKAAATYETRISTATCSVARHIISPLNLPLRPRVCDNICDSCAITEAVLIGDASASVDAIDHSPTRIQIMSTLKSERGWDTRV